MKRKPWIGIGAIVLLIAALVVVGAIFYNIGISRGVATAANLEGFVFAGGPLSHKVYMEGGVELVLLRALARFVFFPLFGFGAMRMGPHHPGWRPMGRYACGDWDEMDTPEFVHKWHSQMHDTEENDEADTPKA